MISKQKIEEWVELYLKHIKETTPEKHVNDEEGYKFQAVDIFQKNFDIEASGLSVILETAIVNNNLVVGSWYFPRKMLLIFAEESPNETRNILRVLFDETRPVDERIDEVEESFDKLMDARNKRLKEKSHHFIGVRFLSLLLGYRYPEVYNALKPREWKIYCSFVDPKFRLPQKTSSGKRYEHFTPYIEAMREHLLVLPEINDLRRRLTEGLNFKDEKFHWMAQDVIYVTSRVLAAADSEKYSSEGDEKLLKIETAEEEKISATAGSRFYYEEDLENFIIENFEKLEFGEGLRVFADEKGTTGQQYHTDYGYIDILALDKVGNFVVIELKRDRAKADFVGQLANYMQWVDDNLAQKSGKKVSGMIIAHRGDEALVNAAKAMRFPVQIKYYQIHLHLEDGKF